MQNIKYTNEHQITHSNFCFCNNKLAGYINDLFICTFICNDLNIYTAAFVFKLVAVDMSLHNPSPP